MNKQIEVLKLALEALETCCAGDYSTGHVIDPSFDEDAVNEAITAIEEALAQPPEPRNFCPRCGKRRGGDVNYIHTCTPPRGLEMT